MKFVVERPATPPPISGLQRHQSTSSNSAVPTVMLVTTSLVYVLLGGLNSIFDLITLARFPESGGRLYREIVQDSYRDVLVSTVWLFIFVYNFYVYLITGKQFRSELRKLFRCSSSSAAAVCNDDVARRGYVDTTVTTEI